MPEAIVAAPPVIQYNVRIQEVGELVWIDSISSSPIVPKIEEAGSFAPVH